MWSQRALLVARRQRGSSSSPTTTTAVAFFATKQKKKGAAAPTLSYFDRKAQRKEANRQAYQDKLNKRQQLQHRRDDAPKDVLKSQFDEWWKPQRIWQEMMDRKARQQGKDWKIRVAAIVERLPVVLPDKEDWERDFEELQAYLGQFGKEYPKELFPDHSIAGDDHSASVPLTDEELLALLPEGFVPAPRETEADHSGDIHTLDRRLKDRVFFVVKEDEDSWTFPTVEIKSDETLLQAAQRAVADVNLELYCPSHAPMAVSMDLLEDDDAFFGTKTFYYRLQYDNGTVAKSSEHAWLDRQEIVENVQEHKGNGPSTFYHYLL